jgi:hypothetical protein
LLSISLYRRSTGSICGTCAPAAGARRDWRSRPRQPLIRLVTVELVNMPLLFYAAMGLTKGAPCLTQKKTSLKTTALHRSRELQFQRRGRSARLAAVQCDQTTVWITHRIVCREEVGQSLQGRVRLLLRWRLQRGDCLDCSSGAFSARWWRLGIFAVAQLTLLPNKHLQVLIDPVCGLPGEKSTPNSER